MSLVLNRSANLDGLRHLLFNNMIFALLCPVASYAGGISGTVVDPAGHVVPDAHVAIICADHTLSMRTDTTGRFKLLFSPL